MPVVMLFGPTAVGKTELLLKQFSCGYEVISADSMQVYRGLDIGTAKPDLVERSRFPHHLIDIRNPSEQFHVGDFVQLADALVHDIISRGKIPVISGGTAFYFRHFLFGLPGTPKACPEVRSTLEKMLEERGLESLYSRLKSCDPYSARRISPGDTYRILRALEVFYSTGKPLSECRVPDEIRPHLAPVIIGLNRSRGELQQRIGMRVNSMMEAGLYEEVLSLMKRGASASWPGMKGIGYREFFFLRESGEFSLERAGAMIAGESRRYARRQLTFFRSLPGVTWVHPDEFSSVRSMVPLP